MKIPWNSVFNEMEKSSFWNQLFAGMTILDMGNQAKKLKQEMALKPMIDDQEFQVKNPYNYQFEGGKNLPGKSLVGPQNNPAQF